jgi:hypothetical protein
MHLVDKVLGLQQTLAAVLILIEGFWITFGSRETQAPILTSKEGFEIACSLIAEDLNTKGVIRYIFDWINESYLKGGIDSGWYILVRARLNHRNRLKSSTVSSDLVQPRIELVPVGILQWHPGQSWNFEDVGSVPQHPECLSLGEERQTSQSGWSFLLINGKSGDNAGPNTSHDCKQKQQLAHQINKSNH